MTKYFLIVGVLIMIITLPFTPWKRKQVILEQVKIVSDPLPLEEIIRRLN